MDRAMTHEAEDPKPEQSQDVLDQIQQENKASAKPEVQLLKQSASLPDLQKLRVRRKTKRHLDLARRRQQTFLEKRRQQKLRRLFLSRVRFLVRLCFTALLCFGLYSFFQLPFLVLDEPRFVLKHNQLLTERDVAPLLAEYQGKPVYEVDPKSVERAIQDQFDIVDRVFVRRHLFPAQLQVSFLEKLPWAEVYDSPKALQPYALMVQTMQGDYELVPLRYYHYVQANYPPDSLSKVVLPRDVPIPPSFMAQLDALAYQLSAIHGLNFQYLDSSTPDQLSAQFEEIGVRIGQLGPTTQERLERLIPLIPKIQEMRDRITWVDLRWSNQITFHKKPPPPSEKPSVEGAATMSLEGQAPPESNDAVTPPPGHSDVSQPGASQ